MGTPGITAPASNPRLARLSAKHRAAMRMIIAGDDNKVIYTKFGWSASSFWRIKHAPLFVHELAKMQENQIKNDKEGATAVTLRAKARLEELSLGAADTLGDLMNSADERVQLAASEAILDRTLPRKVSEGPAGTFGIHITEAVINLFKNITAESDAIGPVNAQVVHTQAPQLEGVGA